MHRLFFILILGLTSGIAQAQWSRTKHHFVFTGLAGGSYSMGNIDKPSFYQLSGRGMWYWKNRIAFGGELGYTKASGTYTNYNATSLNSFVHLRLPLGLFVEGGLGGIAKTSDVNSQAKNFNAGRFISAGFAKSFGCRFALELQYRIAPSLQTEGAKNLNSGLRLGLSVKI